jgi:hypothetical protein
MSTISITDSRRTTRPGFIQTVITPFLMTFMMIGVGATVASADTDGGPGGHSFDGLVPLEHSKVAKAFIDPNADFSVYKRVKILEPFVSFRKNWQRDQNRQASRKVSSSDMQRIKTDVAKLFEEVFSEALQANNGFEIVDETGEDVLLLRPAIIDLDISAPDTLDSSRGRTFTTTAGAATLYIELFDSVSSAIIGRAVDRRTIRSAAGSVAWTNRGTNTADGRRLFRRWADLLRSFLDQHYTK